MEFSLCTGVVPRQNSGTFDFHLGNNVTNLSRNSLIFKVSRHFGEAQRGRLRRSKQPSFARITSDDESALLFSVRWWDVSMELRLYANRCNWMGFADMVPREPPN
jgi:hypothetical protein